MQHDQTDQNPTPNLPTDRRAMLAGIGGLAAGAFLVGKANAGPLNPPAGPVASTGKTLSDIEPRVLLNTTNTPGSATNTLNITQPGSYYLGADLIVPFAASGISINASEVTIDLNGFAIRGQPGSLDGIRAAGTTRRNLAIINGSIASMGEDGIDFAQSGSTANTRVDGLHVSQCGGNGLRLLESAIVRGCTLIENGSNGVSLGDGVVESTVARANGNNGISASAHAVIRGCIATANTGIGIRASNRSTVVDSTASLNTGGGIFVSESCLVERCTASGNPNSFGISATVGCIIRNNTCDGNTNSPGIRVTGTDTRVEENNLTFNGTGLQTTFSGNIIIRNTASGNTTNWIIAAGNVCLVVEAATAGAINGNSGGVSPGSTNPNANFTY
jgi:parallel beta-helix repeat protein